MANKETARPTHAFKAIVERPSKITILLKIQVTRTIFQEHFEEKNYTMIHDKKHYYLERKHKELHLLLKSRLNFFWKSFEEEKYNLTPISATRSSRLLHKTMHLKRKYQ